MDATVQGLNNVSTVKSIVVQFCFANPDVVPSTLPQLSLETYEEEVARTRSGVTGEEIIEPMENVGLCHLVSDLACAGYELVDAFAQPRTKEGGGRQFYQVVRFEFAPHHFVEVKRGFANNRDALLQSLDTMCQQAMWRVRAWLNPLLVRRMLRGWSARSEHQPHCT